jgi:hypothetical protein
MSTIEITPGFSLTAAGAVYDFAPTDFDAERIYCHRFDRCGEARNTCAESGFPLKLSHPQKKPNTFDVAGVSIVCNQASEKRQDVIERKCFRLRVEPCRHSGLKPAMDDCLERVSHRPFWNQTGLPCVRFLLARDPVSR